MTTVETLSHVEEFVARLLATDDADARATLVAQHGLGSSELRDAVMALVEHADRLMGADPRRLEVHCDATLQLAEGSGDEYLRGMALLKYGDALIRIGSNSEACARFDEAETIFKRLGLPVEAARTRRGWAVAATERGLFPQALHAARKARRVFLAHDEKRLAAGLDQISGIIHAELGHYRAAHRSVRAALQAFSTLAGDHRLGIARCRLNLGRILTSMGRYHEALAELEVARENFSQADSESNALLVLRSIGESQSEMGRYSAALQTFEAIRLQSHGEAPDDQVRIACDIATCHLQLNRPADALEALNHVLSYLRDMDDPQAALAAVARRVVALLALGHNAPALESLAEAQARFPTVAIEQRAWIAGQQAAVLIRSGTPDEALAHAMHAEHLARKGGIRRLLADAMTVQAGALLALGDIEGAKRRARVAQRLAQDIRASPLLYRAHEMRGRIAEAGGQLGLARRHYATAIEHLEQEQRGVIFDFRDSFATGRGEAYARLALLQMGAGGAAAALATVERAKSRALTDAIDGAVEIRPRGSAEARRLMQELRRAREEYAAACARAAHENAAPAVDPAALEARISTLTQRLQLAATSDHLTDVYGIARAVTAPDIEQGTLLVEYFACGDDILRFTVENTGVRGEVLAGAVPAADRLLRSFRLTLAAVERAAPAERDRLAGQARTILARLHDLLLNGLGPFERYRALVVVPHGFLHYLPFHAFYDGERYLVERVAVSYAPSATLYGVCRARHASRGRGALVLAHSAGGELPFAVAEGELVGTRLNGDVHSEDAATRALLETVGRRARVIHIAAHGLFRADAPLFSRIELADGPLTAADIFNLDLKAGLVALSACETGRARVGGGDELVGITRAFLYAGAAGLLVSQWRVDDAATARLMDRFYEALADGAGKAAALQTAQRAAIAEHPHPFMWAGFQLIGDDSPLRFRARPMRQSSA